MRGSEIGPGWSPSPRSPRSSRPQRQTGAEPPEWRGARSYDPFLREGARERRPTGEGLREPALRSLLDEILQRLEGGRANLLRRGLPLDRDRLLGKRVDAGAVLGRRLLDGLELEEPRDHELARPARTELLLDELREPVKYAGDALLIELAELRNLRDHLSLGHTLSRHLRFLLVGPIVVSARRLIAKS